MIEKKYNDYNVLVNKLEILNPLNTAMKHNKANLAVIDLISDANIFATGLNVIIPYNAMNAVVLIAIRFFAPLIKRPEPFLIGLSNIYSSFGGSPPKDNEFRESIMMLTIRI